MAETGSLPSGGAKHPPNPTEDDEILKYLLTDSDFSSPEGSPLLVLDNDSPISSDSSPWRTDEVFPRVPSGLPDISIDLDTNPESLLYGSSFNSMDYTSFPIPASVSPAAVVPTPDNTPPSPTHIPTSNSSQTPTKKASRTKKRPRVSDPPPIPSPEKADVALPRDTLLQISSQGMERYVENLASARSLSVDDQKELKRQKRLIKNRESAQLSRERKRAYIDQLEEKISQLVNENTLLRNDNVALRQALSQYQPGILVPKVESNTVDLAYRKADPVATKMAGLLTSATSIGAGRPSTTAKAGVCLLIVLFTFGLFMNSTNTISSRSLITAKGPDSVSELVPYRDRPIGYKRSILEAFPEVMDEEGDEYFESKKQMVSTDTDKLIVPVVENKKQMQRQIIQHPIHVKPAGIYKVSYSPEPAQFLPTETVEDHTHSNKDDNSTYMLFLDPRPDLDNDAEITTPGSKPSDLQVSTHTHIKHVVDRSGLPPMIISLVVPSHIANGSNPLFPKDGYSSDSLMEVTCQVVDVSITTSERPHTR